MKKFDIKVRVYYEDTDAGGIVYHANYLKFFERCRTEWVRGLGAHQQSLLEQSIGFVVRDMEIQFRKSAKLDDELVVCCELSELKRASLTMIQHIFLADDYYQTIGVDAHEREESEINFEVKSGTKSPRFLNKNDILDTRNALVSAKVRVACVNTITATPVAIPNELLREMRSEF